MSTPKLILTMCLLAALAACGNAPATQPDTSSKQAHWQRGGGSPYEIADTEVWDVPDPVSHRGYQIFVALPPSYRDQPQRRYPVLYVTDADYAFPIIKQIARRLNGEGPAIEEFILVGLSYAKGDGGMQSRRRDYTPTPAGSGEGSTADVHGQSLAYISYLRDHALPFVNGHYRADKQRSIFLGHSYGGLLGTQILLTDPRLFSGYVLGSPSLWYDRHYMLGREAVYASAHKDLPARVFMYVGQYEEVRKGDPRYAKTYNMVFDTKNMEKVLRSRHYPSLRMRVEVLDGEDHLSGAPRGFTHGLAYLFSLPKQ